MKLLTGLLLAAVVAFPLVGCQEKKTTVRGRSGETLTVAGPMMPVTIDRGQTKTVNIDLARTGFSGPVEVKISQLPDGVTAEKDTQSVQGNTASFVLHASDSASLVSNQEVKATATGPNDMQATHTFKLTVKEK